MLVTLKLTGVVVLISDLLGAELIKKLLTSACVLLSSKSREVVRATLEFMKVTIGVLPASDLLSHVEDMVSKQSILVGLWSRTSYCTYRRPQFYTMNVFVCD